MRVGIGGGVDGAIHDVQAVQPVHRFEGLSHRQCGFQKLQDEGIVCDRADGLCIQHGGGGGGRGDQGAVFGEVDRGGGADALYDGGDQGEFQGGAVDHPGGEPFSVEGPDQAGDGGDRGRAGGECAGGGDDRGEGDGAAVRGRGGGRAGGGGRGGGGGEPEDRKPLMMNMKSGGGQKGCV